MPLSKIRTIEQQWKEMDLLGASLNKTQERDDCILLSPSKKYSVDIDVMSGINTQTQGD